MEGTEFVNDLCCNYLTVCYEGDEQDFALRMITENAADVFLPVELRRMDGRILLYYNISGMQNMEALYTEKQIDRNAFRTFMWQLHEAMEQSRELFLPGSGICLEPANIFRDLDRERWKFLYIPGKDGEEQEEAQRAKEALAEFFVMHMDYGDKALTETVYRFYEEVCAGGGFSRMDVFWERQEPDAPAGENLFRADPGEEPGEESFSGEKTVEEWGYEEGEEAEESSKVSDGCGSRKLQMILCVLFILAVAATSAAGRIMPDMVLPGGTVSSLLAAALLVISLKRRNGRRVPEDGTGDAVTVNPDEEFYQAADSVGEEEKAYAAEEKTVYMDIQSETERKLYGIGRFRRQKIFLDKLPCLVGKDRGMVNHVISDASVSRMHARFYAEAEEVWMQDLNSTNGTYHNGMRLRPNEKVILEPEDEVGFGRAQFVFR